jgi:hypothetical protein
VAGSKVAAAMVTKEGTEDSCLIACLLFNQLTISEDLVRSTGPGESPKSLETTSHLAWKWKYVYSQAPVKVSKFAWPLVDNKVR